MQEDCEWETLLAPARKIKTAAMVGLRIEGM
jgi:hypothetical protein